MLASDEALAATARAPSLMRVSMTTTSKIRASRARVGVSVFASHKAPTAAARAPSLVRVTVTTTGKSRTPRS